MKHAFATVDMLLCCCLAMLYVGDIVALARLASIACLAGGNAGCHLNTRECLPLRNDKLHKFVISVARRFAFSLSALKFFFPWTQAWAAP
jgi:hypothetical protein